MLLIDTLTGIRGGAFLDVMTLTAVIIARTQAQRNRASVDAVIQIR